MVKGILKFFFAFLVIFSAGNVLAVLLEISPVNDSNEIYVYEREEFSIRLTNDSEVWLENASLSVVPSSGIYVMSAKIKKPSTFKTIKSLAPGETLVEKFELYVGAEEVENPSVKVAFADNNSTFEKVYGLKIVPLPLAISLGEQRYVGNNEYEVDFSITNLSNSEIKFLKVTLLPDNLIEDFESKEITDFRSFENFSSKIRFKSKSNAEQSVRIIFSDAKGTHYIERQIPLNYKKENFPLAIALIVLVVLLLFFYFKTKK